MNDNFFQVFFTSEWKTKEEVFAFIAHHVNTDEQAALVDLLLKREEVGSTLIAPEIILPHLESELVQASQVLFIKFHEPLNWDEATGIVKLAIVIILKQNEEQAVKVAISQFTRTLADEDYLAELLIEEDPEAFYQKIRRNHS
ncbi:PTS sugar transporter subunit IIA [Enterococcus sp. AZ109]|uniref:PTS sugar transporter subunit IIA n=1 Tax=Enterococcus sp. AZ109 TaxID=2774634 RepID=UPI003F216157